MASAAEQLAANINFAAFAKATELQKRIWFTLIALIVYRIGTFIPIPGIDPAAFANAFQQQAGGILGMFNTFSGGAVERMAIFALNVMPYISASIIMQLMSTSVPSLERLKKEGEVGRKQLNQYTRYLTLVLAIVPVLRHRHRPAVERRASCSNPGPFFIASTVITLTGGTMFLMWLGEQVTARGVGNGISLIIFAGIVAELPRIIMQTLALARTGDVNFFAVVAIGAADARGDRVHRLHRALAAPPGGAVSQAPAGQPDVHGRKLVPAAEDQHRRRHSADLRVVAADAADDDHRLSRHAAERAGMGERCCRRYIGYGQPGHMALYGAADHLLLLLLHLDRVQSGRDGRQSAQVRRLPAGHPPRQEDGRISRLRADAPHRDWRGLHHLGLLAAGNADLAYSACRSISAAPRS